jgi:hypothetical protein
MAKDFLKVYANPWFCVDHEGRPCCAVERTSTPNIPGEVHGRWVGATPVVRSSGEVATVGTLTGQIGGDSHEVKWMFSEEIQLVPNFGAAAAYYCDRIREGSLVLADNADAVRLGLKRFVGNKPELVATGKEALTKDHSLSIPTETQPVTTTKKSKE